MPPIEIGPMRPVGAVQSCTTPASGTAGATPAATSASKAAPSGASAATTAAATTAVETSAALNAGSAPVDTDRVSEIRAAVEEGRYPVIPARIGDAMIAAGILLRTN